MHSRAYCQKTVERLLEEMIRNRVLEEAVRGGLKDVLEKFNEEEWR